MFEFNYSIAERRPHSEIRLAMHRSLRASAQALITGGSASHSPLATTLDLPPFVRLLNTVHAIKAGSEVRQLNTVMTMTEEIS